MQRVIKAIYKTLSVHPQFECYLLDDQLEIRVALLLDWDALPHYQRTVVEDFLIGFAMGFISDNNPKHRYLVRNFAKEEMDKYVKGEFVLGSFGRSMLTRRRFSSVRS